MNLPKISISYVTFAALKLNTIRKTKYYVEDDFVYFRKTWIV